MMLQYRELKKRYPDYLLLFRLGDFYELFFEDAQEGADCPITHSRRRDAPSPMSGICRAFLRVLEEKLVEVAETEEQEVVGIALLELPVLQHHWGQRGDNGGDNGGTAEGATGGQRGRRWGGRWGR